MIQSGGTLGRRADVDGRALLIAAALDLFAIHGIEGVSIRAVNRQAGLGPASVHYHFGTKQALLDAVLHEYGDSVIADMQQRARDIAESDEPCTARDLVGMLAAPYLDVTTTDGGAGHAWVRVLGHLLQSEPERFLDRPWAEAPWAAAARVYPEASTREIRRAMGICFTLLVTQFAQTRQGRPASVDLEILVDFLSAGLDATLGPAASDTRPPRSPRTKIA